MKFKGKVPQVALKKCVHIQGNNYFACVTPVEALYLMSMGAYMILRHHEYKAKFESCKRTGTYYVHPCIYIYFTAPKSLSNIIELFNEE